MKWTVCIEGYGEGCDYTIDCNKKFYSYESDATTPEEFAKDLHEHLGDDDGRIYMYDCCERGYGERHLALYLLRQQNWQIFQIY